MEKNVSIDDAKAVLDFLQFLGRKDAVITIAPYADRDPEQRFATTEERVALFVRWLTEKPIK